MQISNQMYYIQEGSMDQKGPPDSSSIEQLAAYAEGSRFESWFDLDPFSFRRKITIRMPFFRQ